MLANQFPRLGGDYRGMVFFASGAGTANYIPKLVRPLLARLRLR
jgi:hypothetical protein